MIKFIEKDDVLLFTVKVVPRASKTEIIGETDGTLKIRISSPPVDGAANAELGRFLSKTFNVSKSNVEIIGGETSRTKKIKVSGASLEKIKAILQAKK